MLASWRLGAAFIFFASLSWPATAACSNKDFCTGWNVVCYRTVPKGADGSECRRRFSECLKTGCFFFSSPRARCKANAEDLALTKSCQRRG